MPPRPSVSVGDVFETNSCGKCTVIEYVNAHKIKVRFETGGNCWVDQSNLNSGKVKDPLYPSVYFIGFVGMGKYSKITHPRLYKLWNHMLERCYDLTYKTKNPTYADCYAVDRWHNFQNFCADIVKMDNWPYSNFELDKDLRVPGNKEYGPKTCSFVPKFVNTSLNQINKGIIKRESGTYRVRVSGILDMSFEKLSDAQTARYNAKREQVKNLLKEYGPYLHAQIRRNLKTYIGGTDLFAA